MHACSALRFVLTCSMPPAARSDIAQRSCWVSHHCKEGSTRGIDDMAKCHQSMRLTRRAEERRKWRRRMERGREVEVSHQGITAVDAVNHIRLIIELQSRPIQSPSDPEHL